MNNQISFMQIYKLHPKEQTEICQEEVNDLFLKKQEMKKEFVANKVKGPYSYLEQLLPMAASVERPTIWQTITRLAYATFNGDDCWNANGRNVLVETDKGMLGFVKHCCEVKVFYFYCDKYCSEGPGKYLYAHTSNPNTLFDLEFVFSFKENGTFSCTNFEEASRHIVSYPFNTIDFTSFMITPGKPQEYENLYDETETVPYQPNFSEFVTPYIRQEQINCLKGKLQPYLQREKS